ncbi:BICD family-like cargo adapter 1 [Leptonychotes weddellii]|uniref:BICD family-like cargo adapter 1 n=1 Tax=Leptonychotes weddellii TaxID=9713 RepID=A0A7F8RAR2_LEPWE|nr:BICD family-like cargo adapter 1 [Leptonychotes weddellii]
MQVHALREDFREKNSSTNQHIIRLESLQAEQVLEIKMLSDRKRELEHRLRTTLEENDLLQGTVEELQDRVLILERQGHDKDLQYSSMGLSAFSVGIWIVSHLWLSRIMVL